MRILILLIGLLSLAACAVGPDYSRPDMSTPASFRMADAEQEATSFANLPWWDLLQDKELQRLIKVALGENKDLKRAVASVEEFQARLFITKMDFAPNADLVANAPSFGRKAEFLFPGFPNAFNYYLQGNLSWELDIWGRIRRSNEAARGDLLAREEARRATILQLVSGVAESYFDLLQLDRQRDIATRTLRSWEDSVKIAQARVRQGVVTKIDADQFVAERANAVARLAELERQKVQKENQLSLLLGRNPGRIARGQSLTEQVMPPDVPPGLPSELLQRRPDVVQAEQGLAAATARIGVAKADRFPKLSITGILGVASPQLSRLVANETSFGVVGLGVAGPLLNAQILGFQQEAAEAQARELLAQYEQTILVAFREVEDALVAVKTAREQRAAQAEQVEALRSALQLASLRYKGGLANYLDVLVAQRSLFEAELALASTHRLQLVSVVQLYKALGGGWHAYEAVSPSLAPAHTRPS
ncbi:MAG: efflux transporter outer membrane subunit [Nitrospirota bacterium]|nr:efflux transporter outer membrane subunit [Nitrospirota bacterium]MDP2382178.1 efflux transporter outer membrane subunit [Nitrospirota bacterium]MDP3595520.1 efflux transporter outer membrane subunit [Nitrospirota bacterium]